MFDHVYFNYQTHAIECGDFSWQRKHDLADIAFVEMLPGSPEALRSPLRTEPQPAPQSVKPAPASETLPLKPEPQTQQQKRRLKKATPSANPARTRQSS